MNADYDGKQYVGIDLHRRRSVIVRMTEDGRKLETVRIDNDPLALSLQIGKAGAEPEVGLRRTFAVLSTTVRYEFDAAWVPFTTGRTLEAAAAIAMKWAEKAAAVHNRPAVLVTDRIGEYHGHEPFERYRRGRHVSPRSSRLDFRPGAVIAHVPTPKALELATRLADGTALAVVEHPSPWRLAGWACTVGARDLLTGETAPALDPKLAKHLNDLIFYGNNGYSRGHGRDGAQRILTDLQTEGLLDHDLVVSALAGLGVSANRQETIAAMIARMVPPQPARLTW